MSQVLQPIAPATSGVATATSDPAGQGSRTTGAHIGKWRSQVRIGFDPKASVKLLPGTTSPWRPNSEGQRFYTAVVSKLPQGATYQSVLDLGAKAGFKAAAVKGHLAWLFTYNGAYLEVGGKLFGHASWKPAPAKARPAKAKAKAS